MILLIVGGIGIILYVWLAEESKRSYIEKARRSKITKPLIDKSNAERAKLKQEQEDKLEQEQLKINAEVLAVHKRSAELWDKRVNNNTQMEYCGCPNFNWPGNVKIKTLYIVKFTNSEEEFYKVGITGQTVQKRFSEGYSGYNLEVIESYKNSASAVVVAENWALVCVQNTNLQYYPKSEFAGYTECFKKEALDVVRSKVYCALAQPGIHTSSKIGLTQAEAKYRDKKRREHSYSNEYNRRRNTCGW